jgi:2-methylcitrate dehydratase PrpD
MKRAVIDKKTGLGKVTQRLCDYAAAAPRRALPPAVVERAKHHTLDTLAAMLSGSRLKPGRRAIEFAAAQGGAREACVIGSRIVTSAITAALANGMHGHADETDDTHYLALVHPGCSIVPAALAMAERQRAGGTALLRAIVLGYDVCARISRALGIERFRTAGHSPHSFGGTFGSAMAAGALAGLNAAGVRDLVSYAAQQVSGLSCWARDVEHVQKAFHFGGMPARDGVTAAVMADMGFTGVPDTLEGDRGFWHAWREYAEPQRLVAGLGSDYEVMNTSIKRWAVGYPIQAPLDALSTLIAKHGIAAGDVASVRITIDSQGAYTVNRRKMASINVQHLAAMMLVDGEITFVSAHDEHRLRDARIAAIRKRITLEGSDAFLRTKTTQAVVEITTRRGERFRHHTKAVLGTAANPMSRAQVAAKARELIVPVIGARKAERLIDTVWRLEAVKDLRALRPLLAAS